MTEPAANEDHGLTPKQKAFADLWAENLIEGGGVTQHDLARAAGYQGSEEVLRVAASRCLAYPKVRDYLHSRAKAFLKEQAMPAAVTLARLTRGAQSERVKADVASRLAVGLGLIEGERGPGGASVVLNLSLSPEFGARLTQPAIRSVEAQQMQAHPAVEHSLAEGEGGTEAVPARAKGGGEGSPRTARKAAGGSKTRARSHPPAPTHGSGRKKSGAGNSLAGKGLGK